MGYPPSSLAVLELKRLPVIRPGYNPLVAYMFELLSTVRGNKRPDTGPVLWLDPSDQPAGSIIVVDKSPKLVTVNNFGVVVADDGPVVGKKSMYFNKASNKYLRIPGAQMFNLVGLQEWQIDYWFKPDGQPVGFTPIIAQWAQKVGGAGFIVNFTAAGRNEFHFGPHNVNGALFSAAPNANLLNWVKYSTRRRGNTFEIWENDVLVATAGSNTVGVQTIDWTIGAYLNASNAVPASGSVPLGGWVADLLVFDFYRG